MVISSKKDIKSQIYDFKKIIIFLRKFCFKIGIQFCFNLIHKKCDIQKKTKYFLRIYGNT